MPIPIVARFVAREAIAQFVKRETQKLLASQMKGLQQAGSTIKPEAQVNPSSHQNLNQAFSKIAGKTKRNLGESTNQVAFWVSINFSKMTYKANAGQIRSQLQSVSNMNKNLKVMEAIIISRARKKHEKITDYKDRAKKAITSRTRAVGSLRAAGYFAAADLRTAAGVKGYTKLKGFGQRKSIGTAAPLSWTPTSSVEITMKAGNSPIAYNYMSKGLEQAVVGQTEKLLSLIDGNVKKDAAEFNSGK